MKEYIDIITPDGQPTGRRKLKKLAEQEGDWHQANHLWIINSRQELLMQKRAATKKFYPSTWDVSTAGNCRAGERPLETAVREAEEELGLKIEPDQLEYLFKCQSPYRNDKIKCHDNHLNYTYLLEMDLELIKLKLQRDELSELKFMNFRELEKRIENKDKEYCPHFEYPKLFMILRKRYDNAKVD